MGFKDILTGRLKKSKKDLKVTELAERTSNGELSTFSGLFKIGALNSDDSFKLKQLLLQYKKEDSFIDKDLEDLRTITCEVKGITNQAVLLHGERIKKAQTILKRYKEGAFTRWLHVTYGNRQTPYNFLQYYELYNTVNADLRIKITNMPRQAVYSLASRSGEFNDKCYIIDKYHTLPKQDILSVIRKTFPVRDKRQPKHAQQVINYLRLAKKCMEPPYFNPDDHQIEEIDQLIRKIEDKLAVQV